VADLRRQALHELLAWWVEQGGEPGDARGFADWLWLNHSLKGRQLPRRYVPAGGLPSAPVPEAVEPDRVDTTRLDHPTPIASRPAAPAPPDPHTPSVFPPAPAPADESAEAVARLLSSALLPNDGDVREQLLRRTGAVPLLLSQMPLLQRPLPLLMALRPLLQKQPHPRRRVLDEERSAERSADLGRPWPVFSPRKVPAVEVHLWLDAGVAMAVWWPLAQDLQRLLASSQAFAKVALHRFGLEQLEEATSAVRRGRQSSDGTTLHLLLSDTAGRHWWDGSMALWLEGVAQQGPVAIVHTLPMRYWERTAMRSGTAVTLSNGRVLGPNSGYQAVPLANLEPRRRSSAAPLPPPEGLRLPVLSLDPRDLAPWAALVMGDRLACSGGTVLPLADPSQPLPLPSQAVQPDAEINSAQANTLWLAFCQQASPEAQRLMRQMAAAPLLTLPVLRLLLAAELPDQLAPLPLAEVLVSGLVRRCEGDGERNPNLVQFELLPAVQQLLETQLDPYRRVKVIQAITDLLERHWNQQGRRDSFQTLLTDPRTPLPAGAEGLAHIANVTAAMLDRLPGQPFRELAQELRAGTGSLPPALWPPAVAFEEEVFETAQLVEVPPLELVRFETAWFAELNLKPLKFTTAKIQPSAGVRFRARGETARDPEIAFSEGSAWCFHEPLWESRDVTAQPLPQLTLVEIPAGTFQMGSPPDEPERSADEGPLHEVTVQGFFISQTPITQAQWRQVAEWTKQPAEHWGHELKPNPSVFDDQPDSDQRPVENVRWHDVMEFCRRLSQRTGRTYTLPSETQWEYACRAGSITPFHFGSTITPELVNYDGNAIYADGTEGLYRRQTTPVGMFPANDWGLHDMHGNVWEWCLDHRHGSYEGAPADGRARFNPFEPTKKATSEKRDNSDSEEEMRLLRGGSWLYGPRYCRSAYRYLAQPVNAYYDVGFRVVCLPQDPSLNP
jgi:formylglycine-generating enzyme required for sulfatase activity